MKTYLVYEITYHGDIPKIKNKRYIGRAMKVKWEKGYLGTPTSKQYGKIWQDACRLTPLLFSRKILFESDNRLEVSEMEEQIQRERNVVRSDDYINTAYANKHFDTTGKKLGPLSEEHKQKIREFNLGRKKSEETKQKMRKPRSEETKQKISNSHKGKKRGPHSEETRQKMSDSHKGRKKGPQTKEHKKNISAGVKRYWAEKKGR